MKLLLLAAMIFSPAASWAAGSGCQDTSGSLILEKMRTGATGPQLFGCINRSFDTLSPLSGAGSTNTFHLVFIDTIAGGSGGEGLYISTDVAVGGDLHVTGELIALRSHLGLNNPEDGAGVASVNIYTSDALTDGLYMHIYDTGGLNPLKLTPDNGSFKAEVISTYLLILGGGDSQSTIELGGREIAFNSGAVLSHGTTFYVVNERVGIGTTDPSSILYVLSGGNIVASPRAPGITISNTAAGGIAGLNIIAGTGSYSEINMGAIDTGAAYTRIVASVAGDLNFVTNNSTRVVILDGGNVGIGNTAPGTELEVGGASNNVEITINAAGGAGFDASLFLEEGGAHQWSVKTEGTDNSFRIGNASEASYWLTILQAGNVGIGTTNPGAVLQVGGDAENVTGVIRYESSDGDEIDTGVTNADDFYITGGQVGIGLTNPATDLHVSGTSGVTIDIGTANTGLIITSTDDTTRITLTDDDTTGHINVNNAYVSIGGQTSLNAGNLNIKIADGSVGIGITNPQGPLHVGANFLLVESGGDIGIGTTSPDARVEIESNAAPNAFVLLVSSQSGAGTSFLTIQGDGDVRINDSGTSANFQIDSSAGAGAFFVKGTGGNVGIGTTNPGYKLDVLGSVSIQDTATTSGKLVFEGRDPTIATCANAAVHTNSSGSMSQITFSGNNTSCAITFPADTFADVDDVYCFCNGDDGSGATNGCYINAHSTTGFTALPFASQWQNGDHIEIACFGVKAE